MLFYFLSDPADNVLLPVDSASDDSLWEQPAAAWRRRLRPSSPVCQRPHLLGSLLHAQTQTHKDQTHKLLVAILLLTNTHTHNQTHMHIQICNKKKRSIIRTHNPPNIKQGGQVSSFLGIKVSWKTRHVRAPRFQCKGLCTPAANWLGENFLFYIYFYLFFKLKSMELYIPAAKKNYLFFRSCVRFFAGQKDL